MSDSFADAAPPSPATIALEPVFGPYYFGHDCGDPYERSDAWLQFFGGIAKGVVAVFAPATVLDVGCAKGFLVEALRDQGVSAWGIDVSEYAIADAVESVRPYCAVSGADEDLPESFPPHYDLVTCIEVLEHLPDAKLALAIANVCRWADRILFSSSPDDYTEVTHLNVHPSDFWVSRMAFHGFVRDFEVDASFMTTWAIVFKRVPATLASVAGSYERAYGAAVREAREARKTGMQLTAKLEELELGEVARLAAEVARLEDSKVELERLRELVGPNEVSYAALQRELWRLRDELLGLQGELGVARGARALMEANQASAENRANFLASRLDQRERDHHAVLTSRQYRAGRWVVGPLRRLRRMLRGG